MVSTKDYEYIEGLVRKMYGNKRIEEDIVTRLTMDQPFTHYSSAARGERLEQINRVDLAETIVRMLAGSVNQLGDEWHKHED